MATLMKEKRKEKKKSKVKTATYDKESNLNSLHEPFEEEPENVGNMATIVPEVSVQDNKIFTLDTSKSYNNIECTSEGASNTLEHNVTNTEFIQSEISTCAEYNCISDTKKYKEASVTSLNVIKINKTEDLSFKDLNKSLQKIKIPDLQNSCELTDQKEDIKPSAPVFNLPTEANVEKHEMHHEPAIIKKKKAKSIPLAEAIRIFGGREIAEVKGLSEREEVAVETGPTSGPDHPLVDLLSTFRSSLSALEKERVNINCGYIDEEKRRSVLWKIEKKSITITEQCPCGANVELHVLYDYAELQKDRLPVAKMRLEGLLRDVQETYCHHQHAALLAYSQIDELISDTVQCNKGEIREALSLILQALRLSDGAPVAFPQALERWTAVLADALIDERDLRQLLFIIHHLFRQSRSVQWAGRILRARANDLSSAARVIAILDLLLTGNALENAYECVEDESWEEVDVKGDSGAVGEGRLRERDLMIVLNSLPLREIVARLALFSRADITDTSEYEWGDLSGGHGVLKASCGARVLLDVISRGARTHHGYVRLRDRLRTLAASLLHALAALHMHSRNKYTKELEDRIESELEACFSMGLSIMGEDLDKLPATLLTDDSAREYCMAFENLHDKSPQRVEALNTIPVVSCESRVKVVTQVAIDRLADNDLASAVLQFLFETGIKRKPANLKCSCDSVARENISRLLDAHPYLYTTALHIFADISQGESIESNLMKHLYVSKWRPNLTDLQQVINDWTQKCPQIIQYLLLDMDYTPHSGVSLEAQLYIGWWASQIPEAPEWTWALLKLLRLHRSHWALPLEAPGLDKAPDTLSDVMFALLATDWGHCVPLACGPGVDALHRLALSRPVEALHCLGQLVTVMATSPESISLTPKFAEIITVILNWRPNLVQRAFGRGGQNGADLLQNLVIQQLQDKSLETRSAMLTAWLHMLWTPAQVGSSRGILDSAVRFTQDWRTLDNHVSMILQAENSKQYIDDALRHSSTAPLLCESVLRRAHGTELQSGLYVRLLDVLALQRDQKQRIHVDNAIKKVGGTMSSEDLVIHRTANTVLSVPFSHPAHLTLWRLFLHLFLQRPPSSPHETSPPVGPLFFSGLVKTRTLAQLKKRLQETITYHQQTAELYHSPTVDSPEKSNTTFDKSPTSSNIFPELSISDMFEESSDESNSDVEIEDNVEVRSGGDNILVTYHNGAERMVREYVRWLEEGDKVRAYPHNADIAIFIPEQALSAAWELSHPYNHPSPSVREVPVTLTYYEQALRAVRNINERTHQRKNKRVIKSLVENVNFSDTRVVLKFIEKHLVEVEQFSREWSSEVSRISQLDGRLWELVGKLRMRRPLPPVKKSCSQNCTPITIRIAEDEWCISTAAEREIQENRRSSRANVRRLCRARPHFARTAAALISAATHARNADTAVSVCERVWRYTPLTHTCTHAQQLLANVVALLAEKWISHDSRRIVELLSRWSRGDSTQQLLCSALISPTKLPMSEWSHVYVATCKANLPSHTTFSYLSKFDISRWAIAVETAQRREVLLIITDTAQKWGPKPDTEHHVLIELLGVHSHAIVSSAELNVHVCEAFRRAASGKLPPGFCAHLTRAVESHAHLLTFDQIGHFLRDLGSIWWEARKSSSNRQMYPQYATHVAAVLTSLQRAFVEAARNLSYAPERVTLYSWSSMVESWSAWISPQSLEPLLPSTCEDEKYTQMLQNFLTCVLKVLEDSPDSTESLLYEIWSWCVETYCANSRDTTQECRVQLSALLSIVLQLDWRHQWFKSACLPRVIQISESGDREITTWSSVTLSHTRAETWLRSVPDVHVAPTLGALFDLFVSKNMQYSEQFISECCGVSWWRLPTEALDQLLEKFYFQHHNPGMPYCDLPQFRIVLSASQLSVHPNTPSTIVNNATSHVKRCRAVSQYVRAVVSPPLQSHLRTHVTRLLQVITELVPYTQGHLEEILSRIMVIMCMEPAAKIVLPVLLQWLSQCNSTLRVASMSSVASITVFDYFLPLADLLAKTHLNSADGTGWQEAVIRWKSSPWWEASACLKRAGLYAAYALLRARPNEHTPERICEALLALNNTAINFSENEEIIALWICVVSRIATTQGEDARECRNVAQELIDKWAIEPKRSLLQVVALQTTAPAPTPRHRILCRFAQCITSPSDTTARLYEAAVNSVLGSTPGDVVTWCNNPSLKKLLQLANKLYPNRELYFGAELQ
ncbi:unnamed protein product [Pieris macdunnoughi]|uniref:Epg5-like TPR domain-containing protein n=1 Tax=Pieris macdunnoughi TaxID=345717 RepID=A0A821Q438_9NEOP|nr:unnamed protein product [Pieris macdunnoughi]